MGIVETAYLVPYSLYFFLAMCTDLLKRRKLIYLLSVFEYRNEQLCCGKVFKNFTLPCMLGVEYLKRFGVVNDFIVNT